MRPRTRILRNARVTARGVTTGVGLLIALMACDESRFPDFARPPPVADAGGEFTGDDASAAPCERDDCTCYSPTQNLDRAYARDATGCDCDLPPSPGREPGVCIGGVITLICSAGRWVSAEDGDCARVDACAASFSTLVECLQSHDSCAQEKGGSFCARDPR